MRLLLEVPYGGERAACVAEALGRELSVTVATLAHTSVFFREGSLIDKVPSGSDMRTYRQMRDDPTVDEDLREERLVDEALGLTAALLVRRDHVDVASVLGRIVRTEVEESESSWSESAGQGLWLEYEPEDKEDFERHEYKINDVFTEVVIRARLPLDWLRVREVFPEVGYGWRQQLPGSERPTNQARKVRRGAVFPTADFLAFTNHGELNVYLMLKEFQERLPRHETITIIPLAAARIPDHTWEPDIVVTYKGRAGLLEVDGPHHNQRRALDMSREHLFHDSGFFYMDRVPVEALDDLNEIRAVVKRFMRRLRDG